MKRKIISIDRELCNGCGLCVDACHEGALVMIDGKAALISDSYCDGLGDCLPECPVDAIKIEARDAAPYDKEAVDIRIAQREKLGAFPSPTEAQITAPIHEQSENYLLSWPLQIQLVHVGAPFFDGAHLLIAADCTAFSYGGFHEELLKGRVCLIGCPKLDPVDYSEKLGEIIKQNDIQSVTVARMEVPCCSGIVNQVEKALKYSEKMIPWSVRTVSTEGQIV